MSNLKTILSSASGPSMQGKLYVDDVFSTYTYTGNGSTQTINNGIDLAGEGGLVWTKGRDNSNADHVFIDTVRGRDYKIASNATSGNSEILPSHLFESFNSDGYTTNNYSYVNTSGGNYVSWTFRRTPKFFDIVTFTTNAIGNGYFTTTLSENIGMALFKSTASSGDWLVWHRYNDTKKIILNSTAAATDNSTWVWSDGVQTYGASTGVANATYVAYLFAHDPNEDGIIRCGSYIGSSQSVSNTYYSSTSITIPTGVTSLKLIGTGGSGTSVYNPGQAYIAPVAGGCTGSVTFPAFGLDAPNTITMSLNGSTKDNITGSASRSIFYSSYQGYSNVTVTATYYCTGVNSSNLASIYAVVTTATPYGHDGGSTYGAQWHQASINCQTGSPGQPYIAPYYTYTTGQSATANINGQTYTFAGGYGGAATPVTQTITLPGTSQQTLTLTIPSGGNIQVEYSYSSTSATEVNLGFEPQYVLIKNASGTGNWVIIDSMRGMTVDGNNQLLFANSSGAEITGTHVALTSTGFKLVSSSSDVNASNNTYIYMAIRRSNKPALSGSSIFDAQTFNPASAGQAISISTGFNPDMVLMKSRDTWGGSFIYDKVRGNDRYLSTVTTNAEVGPGNSYSTVREFISNGASIYSTPASKPFETFIFKRAPGFFDIVSYTGKNTTQEIKHNLGVIPELIIHKSRSSAEVWFVHTGFALTNQTWGFLNSSNQMSSGLYSQAGVLTGKPTASSFTITAGYNGTGINYIAYLFASLPGISKVGSYTGNGTSQTIDCGFASGARFILIKRTDSTGDWLIADTVRGIVTGNDPRLSLNTTSAEVTTEDWLDPHSSGFIINQVDGSNANASNGQYIFLAIA